MGSFVSRRALLRGILVTAGASLLAACAPAPSAAPRQMRVPQSGEAAVRESRRMRERKEAVIDADEEAAPSSVRKVGGKTFYLREGVWTDAEFDPAAKLPETVLTFGADAYFDAVKREPKLADFFALGERVVVVYKGRVYRVGATQ